MKIAVEIKFTKLTIVKQSQRDLLSKKKLQNGQSNIHYAYEIPSIWYKKPIWNK